MHNFVSLFRSLDDAEVGIEDCTAVLDHRLHIGSFGTDAMWQLHFEKFKPLRCPACNRSAEPIYHCSHVERNQKQGRAWRRNSSAYVDPRVDISDMLYEKVLSDNFDAVAEMKAAHTTDKDSRKREQWHHYLQGGAQCLPQESLGMRVQQAPESDLPLEEELLQEGEPFLEQGWDIDVFV